MLRIVVLRCPTLYLRWTASGTCCATLLQRCKQAAWRHLEAANCHVFRHRWKTLDSGLATLASVWTTLCNVGESITLLDHVVQRCAALHNLWQRCIIAGERWTAFVQRCYNVAKKLPNVISYAGRWLHIRWHHIIPIFFIQAPKVIFFSWKIQWCLNGQVLEINE